MIAVIIFMTEGTDMEAGGGAFQMPHTILLTGKQETTIDLVQLRLNWS